MDEKRVEFAMEIALANPSLRIICESLSASARTTWESFSLSAGFANAIDLFT